MATGVAGLWSVVPKSVDRPIANVSAAGQGDGSSANTATIAANDFLTLLVTEMKNQDPTATTDPNEYVNQLVQVNSLQQLISINETLQKATNPATGSSQTPTSELSGPSYTRAGVLSLTDKEANETGSRGVSSAARQIATALTR